MNENIQRTFITGDEWLYYKFYTGAKTADVILSGLLKPVTRQLLSDSIIDKWFFIRYADPKQHIRVRFHYTKPQYVFNIIQAVNTLAKPYIEQNLIWKIQLDTYQREIERYGTNTMELAESLFFHDSNMIVAMLDMIEGDEGETIRWQFALKAIDTLLNDFRYDLKEKQELLSMMKENFAKEFGMNRLLKQQLDKKYRKNQPEIYNILSNIENPLTPLSGILEEKSNSIMPAVSSILGLEKNGKLQTPLNDLMSSYIHMLNNRLFKSKQRIHEMVVYDFLFRYYRSELARRKT